VAHTFGSEGPGFLSSFLCFSTYGVHVQDSLTRYLPRASTHGADVELFSLKMKYDIFYSISPMGDRLVLG
jgi:hypothetical protein